MNREIFFSQDNFHHICDRLARQDKDLAAIISRHGYPPLWGRKAGFATLVHVILEQQVSLASARSAYYKLKEKVGTITAAKVLALAEEELKACYFSRQKIKYVQHLATAVINKELVISKLGSLPNDEIREKLTSIKGIGNWTVDVYLMMVLHRCDLFPMGDIALVNSLTHIKQLPKETSIPELEKYIDKWRPYRTIAAFLLWHDYIKRKNMKIVDYD